MPIEYVIPNSTILIENPIAVDDEERARPQAKAFVNFLRTPPAQKIFGAATATARSCRASLEAVPRSRSRRSSSRSPSLGGWNEGARRGSSTRKNGIDGQDREGSEGVAEQPAAAAARVAPRGRRRLRLRPADAGLRHGAT